jgi:hypothetical protein
VTRWLWGIRPSNDCTTHFLEAIAKDSGLDVTIIVEQHAQLENRIERLSVAGDMLLANVNDGETVLWHESDLLTRPSVAIDLWKTIKSKKAGVVGGWPMLSHNEDCPDLVLTPDKPIKLSGGAFYDTWGYRIDGTRFTNNAPFHISEPPLNKPFQLDSVGSVVMISGEYNKARMGGEGLVGLCQGVRNLGGTVWCDPRVPVIQPVELWKFEND